MDSDNNASVKPAWLAPVLVLVVVLILAFTAKKKSEAVENPVVDGAIIATIVFAYAAVFRWLFSKLDAPGAVTFFGGPVRSHPADNATAAASGY